MIETILKRFEAPDEVREFEKGRFDLVSIGGLSLYDLTRVRYSTFQPNRMTAGSSAKPGTYRFISWGRATTPGRVKYFRRECHSSANRLTSPQALPCESKFCFSW